MKKRVAGGVVLVAIGIGVWLSNLFTGIGPGGAGTNVGIAPEVHATLDNAENPDEATSEVATEGTTTAGGSRPIVVIDGQEFFLEQQSADSSQFVPTTLEQIVDLARQAEPDADGIRVQIKRRGSSRPSAESALDEALQGAGLSEQQIQRHAGFVE